MNLLLLYHPKHGEQVLSQVTEFFTQHGKAWTSYCSRGDFNKDVAALRALATSHDRVVVLGGDGTLHLAANAFACTKVSVALIPCGSGNDFARQWREPLLSWLHQAVFGVAKPISLGRVDNRYFINIASVGFGAQVVSKTQHKTSARAYIWQGFCAIWRYTDANLHWRKGKQVKQGAVIMFGFANGQYFGAGLRIAPNSSVYAAGLELFSVPKAPKWRLIRTFLNCLMGAEQPDGVYYEHVEEPVHLTSDGMLIEADGEIIGRTPCCVSSQARALHFVAPRPNS